MASTCEELARQCDILTVEIEHVNADVLEQVEKEGLCEVQPAPKTIRLIQDKYLQKAYLSERGIPVAPFEKLPENPTEQDVKALTDRLGLPVMLKASFVGAGKSPMGGKLNFGFRATGSVNRSDFDLGMAAPVVSDRVDLQINAAFAAA